MSLRVAGVTLRSVNAHAPRCSTRQTVVRVRRHRACERRGGDLDGAGSTRAAAGGQLEAIVGTNDGFDITLNDANGDKVARLAPGTYTIVVHDRSALHNFHMASNTDPTVDFRTGIEFVGDETFTVTFKPGAPLCVRVRAPLQVMNGEFRIDELPTTTPAPRRRRSP